MRLKMPATFTAPTYPEIPYFSQGNDFTNKIYLPVAKMQSWHLNCIISMESVLFVERLYFQHPVGLKVLGLRAPSRLETSKR
jgi:hypothetical protein